jgi:hypothetical protein
MAGFTADDVLSFLERCLLENPLWSFVNLEHPYVYTANSRLTLFADAERWAIVSEVSGYSGRAARFELTVTWLGNTLRDLPRGGANGRYTYNFGFFTLLEQRSLAEFSEKFAAGTARLIDLPLRGRMVQVPGTLEEFQKLVPDILTRAYPRGLQIRDLARYLAYAYPDLYRATDTEKRMHLPSDLPYLMMIDQWHHRSFAYYRNVAPARPIGDAPSSYETYCLIAEVLATRDSARYGPTLAANSHWSNWPNAGSL